MAQPVTSRRLVRKPSVVSLKFEFKEVEKGIRQNFKPYNDIIENLTFSLRLRTQYPIIHCEWSHNGSVLVLILKVSNEHIQIR